jgi:hypothetical protein
MVIDNETFTELAVRLRMASDAILTAARNLTVLGTNDGPPPEAAWGGTIDSMLSLSNQLGALDRLLYAVLDANRDQVPVAVPDDTLLC